MNSQMNIDGLMGAYMEFRAALMYDIDHHMAETCRHDIISMDTASHHIEGLERRRTEYLKELKFEIFDDEDSTLLPYDGVDINSPLGPVEEHLTKHRLWKALLGVGLFVSRTQDCIDDLEKWITRTPCVEYEKEVPRKWRHLRLDTARIGFHYRDFSEALVACRCNVQSLAPQMLGRIAWDGFWSGKCMSSPTQPFTMPLWISTAISIQNQAIYEGSRRREEDE